MSLRTPLGRVLGFGSAKEGTGHWWSQRLTAMGMLLLGAWFLISLLRLPAMDHASIVAWLSNPWSAGLMLLLAATLTWHSSLGVQVVIEDYVHGPFLKVASLVIAKFAHVAIGVAAAMAVLKIAFGSN